MKVRGFSNFNLLNNLILRILLITILFNPFQGCEDKTQIKEKYPDGKIGNYQKIIKENNNLHQTPDELEKMQCYVSEDFTFEISYKISQTDYSNPNIRDTNWIGTKTFKVKKFTPCTIKKWKPSEDELKKEQKEIKKQLSQGHIYYSPDYDFISKIRGYEVDIGNGIIMQYSEYSGSINDVVTINNDEIELRYDNNIKKKICILKNNNKKYELKEIQFSDLVSLLVYIPPPPPPSIDKYKNEDTFIVTGKRLN